MLTFWLANLFYSLSIFFPRFRELYSGLISFEAQHYFVMLVLISTLNAFCLQYFQAQSTREGGPEDEKLSESEKAEYVCPTFPLVTGL